MKFGYDGQPRRTGGNNHRRQATARTRQARQQRALGWPEGKEVVYYGTTPVRSRGGLMRRLRNFSVTSHRRGGSVRIGKRKYGNAS